MIDDIMTLGMLILLQAVLGFDNLLYVSLESKRAPADKQSMVRWVGILLAVALRIGLLFVVMRVISVFQDPVARIHQEGIVEGSFNVHSIIVLLGGIFIIYTATKEIWHMMAVPELEHEHKEARSLWTIIVWIVAMNLVFSFDSILSALALTDVFWVMATAIVTGGVLMIWMADRVAGFLERNRMYEVLGLFILLVVGIMLVTEGGHLAHLALFGREIMPMTKATFYFVIVIMLATDVVQSRYRKKLLAQQARRSATAAST